MIINTQNHCNNIITLEDLKTSQPNKYWIINNDIHITDGEHTIGNISIEFLNGKFTGNGTLNFNYATLVANEKKCIIDNSITCLGKITNHKVYTDWFGLTPNDKNIDYSIKINQIINLLSVGTIYFPKGGFYIGSPIYQKCGIDLEGYRASLEGVNQGTCFFLKENPSQSMLQNKCFILINTIQSNPNQSNGWIVAYPVKETCVKDIYFYNSYHKKEEKYRGYKAILAAGKFLVERCHFDGIDQAVCVNHSVYIDNKMVHDCVYWTYGLLNDHSDLPAFDLSGLGDGLSFIRNSANSDTVLKLSMCMGGLIQNNILHGGIEIDGCKNIRIDSNHMERWKSKTQMRINSSQVVVSNNFMWKESIPNISIGKKSDFDDNISECVVSLENNNFMYYENEDVTQVDIGCEYDIELSKKSSLSITNCFRYITLRNRINSTYPCGIKIKSADGLPINSFNYKSHLLSKRCIISKNNKINEIIHYDVPSLVIPIFQTNTGILWKGKQDTVRYFYEFSVLLDKDRQLRGINTTSQQADIGKSSGGILIKIADLENKPNQGMMLCIKRTHHDGGNQIIKYCVIPVLSQYLYDNGLNINGFPYTDEAIQTVNIAKGITYKGDNVETIQDAKSNGGVWKTGDKVIYTSGTNTFSIYTTTWKHF